jgi:alpha-D-ribose 1-methylphosphonate 5-triphosphate synthase subunit PhnI
MYVAVKGGETAIRNAHALLAEERRGDPEVPELSLDQVREQLTLAVDRVMTEGSLYDRDLAALAVKQARGDLTEAIFLLRAYRTTLPRLAVSEPIDTGAMTVRRRITATYKDLPGGQVLGPTFDYTHRLLDFSLAAGGAGNDPAALGDPAAVPDRMPKAVDVLDHEGLIERERASSQPTEPTDLTRGRSISRPAATPACRTWRAATRASCWRSPIRASAASAARTPSPARSAWARWRSRSCLRSWASPSRSAPSR